MLKPIEIELPNGYKTMVHCVHEDMWPPAHMELGRGLEELRRDKVITDMEYEQIKTWQRNCGRLKMGVELSNDEKVRGVKVCGECPLAMTTIDAVGPNGSRIKRPIKFEEWLHKHRYLRAESKPVTIKTDDGIWTVDAGENSHKAGRVVANVLSQDLSHDEQLAAFVEGLREAGLDPSTVKILEPSREVSLDGA